jgi:hypothetical protein
LKKAYSLLVSRKNNVTGAKLNSSTAVVVIAVRISATLWGSVCLDPNRRLKK